jgi:WD40 repeat protein
MSATLKCAGMFEKKGILSKERTFKYAVGNDVFIIQRPQRIGKVSAFTCIAASDKYVAIGSNGRVQVFIIDGKFAGRWVYSDDISNGVINKLCFSPDGRQLVALLVYGNNNIEEARIYPADRFPNGDLERTEVAGVNLLKPVPIQWEHDFIHNPSGIAFSSNGKMVAFCTSHSNRKAKIRILKKEEATWRHWGSEEIIIFGTDHHDWTGGGFTGISLYISIDYTNLVFKMTSIWCCRWIQPTHMLLIGFALFLSGRDFDLRRGVRLR